MQQATIEAPAAPTTPQATAVPGAAAEPRQREEVDEAGLFFGGMSLAIFLMMAYRLFRRKFWKRRPNVAKGDNLQLPGELAVRLERLENVAEATALEVERIGEGQRFVTRLLSEQKGAAQPVRNDVTDR